MKKLLLCVFLVSLTPGDLLAKTIYRAKSLYRDIYVVKEGDLLCLKFSIPRKQDTSQSCKNVKKPDEMVFNYTKMTMASVLLNNNPKSILVVGLGGGTLPTALHDMYPDAQIISLDIDPAVADVAKEYFEFQESENNKVVIRDARLFIKREVLKNKQYDLIILDAFGSDYIPEHLTTVEFLEEVKSILSPDGVIAANTFSSPRLYKHELSTYAKVFGDFYVLRMPGSSNRVLLHSLNPKNMLIENIDKNATLLKERLKKYNVDARGLYKSIDTVPSWDEDARPLTDQYSPSNVLNAK